MRPAGLFSLYRARLRERAMLAREGFAVLGIAVGVALLFASQVAVTSLTGAAARLDRQIVGDVQLQLKARGPDGMSGGLLAQVQRAPGVAGAFAVLEREVNARAGRGTRSLDLIGVDPRSVRLGPSLRKGLTARQLEAQQAIALPAPIASQLGLATLQPFELQIGASVRETLLGATFAGNELGGLARSPVALAALSYAQRLTGLPDRVTRILVRVVPGRIGQARIALSRLAGRAGVNLVDADYDARLFAQAVGPQRNSETLFSGISALVGFMIALNAMLIAAPARLKLVEAIAPQGATRRALLTIVLFDGAVLGALGCLLGLLLGEALSRLVFHATPGYLAAVFPLADQRIVTWQSVALALGAGMAAALAGVLWPLRATLATRLTPSRHSEDDPRGQRELRPRAHPRAAARREVALRATAGIGSFAFATFTLLALPAAIELGNLALILALVTLLPLAMRAMVLAFARVQSAHGARDSARGARDSGGGGMGRGAARGLASITLQAPPTRLRALAVTATAAVAVFGAVSFQGIQANLTGGLDAVARSTDANADIWVTPTSEADTFTTLPFAPVSARLLARLPGVADVGEYRGSFLDWADRRDWIAAPASYTARPSVLSSQLAGHALELASARLQSGGWVAISRALAAEHHLAAGQTFTLPAPRPLAVRVAALIDNLGWPPGAILMNAGDYARAWGSSDPSAYEIQLDPGAPLIAVRERVRRALGPRTGLTVETAGERERLQDALAAQGLARLTQIRVLMLIAAALAIAGALGSLLWQRRALVAFMKIEGYPRAVLWRWLVCESAILFAGGCALGAAFGLYSQLLGSRYLSSATGFPVDRGLEGLAALSGFGLVVAAAIAIAALPGYLAVRVPASATEPAG